MQNDRPRRGKGRKGRDNRGGPAEDSGFFTNDGFEAELDAVAFENTALNNMDPIREAQLFEQFEQDYRSGGYDPGTNVDAEETRERFGPDPRDISGYRPLAKRTDSGYHLAPEDHPADDRRRDDRRPNDRRANDSRANNPRADRRPDDRRAADHHAADRHAADRRDERRPDDRRDDRRADARRGDRPRHGRSRPPEGGARIPMFTRKTSPAPGQRPSGASQPSPFGELTGYVVPIAVAVVIVMVLVVLLLNR
jgi:hypothetical protein